MKKSHLLLGLGISISLLTACQKQENTTSSTSQATTTTIEEITIAPKPVTDYTLYNSVLQDYKEALAVKFHLLYTQKEIKLNMIIKKQII